MPSSSRSAELPTEAVSDEAGPRIDRRRFLRVGGWTVAWAAVVVACDDAGVPSARRRGQRRDEGRAADATIIRTASSLEEVAVTVYRELLRSGVFSAAEVVERVTLFRDHHREHAALLRSLSEEVGGEPFTEPNPVVLAGVQPRVDAVTGESAALQLVAEVETTLAETYQASVGELSAARLNQGVMAIGAAEARHAGLLATVAGQPPAPDAFQPLDLAVATGTGV